MFQRGIATCIAGLAFAGTAFAGPAQANGLTIAEEDIARVVTKLDLQRFRPEAHARCVSDVPSSIYWLNEPKVAEYCVVRYGAPRKVGLFMGVQLAIDLERTGHAAEAEVIEALIAAQAAREEASSQSRRP